MVDMRIGVIGCGGRGGLAAAAHRPDADAAFHFTSLAGGHGEADTLIVAEFLRYVREGGEVATSPIAARYAAGCQAAVSLRNGSQPRDIPDVAPEIRAYFVGPRDN